MNKILSDNQIIQADITSYDYEPEKTLLLKLLDYPDVVRLSARDFEPHKVATYLYEIARELNRYYESTPVATGVVTDIQKQARLAILQKVSHIFTHGLSLLGIEVPMRM